jgi:ketosteroid isomerase-like protein
MVMVRVGGRRAGRGVILRVMAGIEVLALVLVLGCAAVSPRQPVPFVQPSASLQAKSTTPPISAVATAAVPTDEPTATGGARTVKPQGASQATESEREIRAVLDRWAGGVNDHDLDEKMGTYADTISPFFGMAKATKADARKVFGGAFSRYEHMSQQLERIDIKVTGDRAVVVVYKTRVYDGDPGWAEERIGFERTPDGWRIVSEQDIRASD